MCNLINIHTYVVLDRSIYVQFSACVLCILQINRSGLNQLLYPIIYIRGCQSGSIRSIRSTWSAGSGEYQRNIYKNKTKRKEGHSIVFRESLV